METMGFYPFDSVCSFLLVEEELFPFDSSHYVPVNKLNPLAYCVFAVLDALIVCVYPIIFAHVPPFFSLLWAMLLSLYLKSWSFTHRSTVFVILWHPGRGQTVDFSNKNLNYNYDVRVLRCPMSVYRPHSAE